MSVLALAADSDLEVTMSAMPSELIVERLSPTVLCAALAACCAAERQVSRRPGRFRVYWEVERMVRWGAMGVGGFGRAAAGWSAAAAGFMSRFGRFRRAAHLLAQVVGGAGRAGRPLEDSRRVTWVSSTSGSSSPRVCRRLRGYSSEGTRSGSTTSQRRSTGEAEAWAGVQVEARVEAVEVEVEAFVRGVRESEMRRSARLGLSASLRTEGAEERPRLSGLGWVWRATWRRLYCRKIHPQGMQEIMSTAGLLVCQYMVR